MPKKRTIVMQQDPTVCPYCSAVHNALSGDAVPEQGDISICFNCTRPSVIDVKDGELSLRQPATPDEKAECQEALRQICLGR